MNCISGGKTHRRGAENAEKVKTKPENARKQRKQRIFKRTCRESRSASEINESISQRYKPEKNSVPSASSAVLILRVFRVFAARDDFRT